MSTKLVTLNLSQLFPLWGKIRRICFIMFSSGWHGDKIPLIMPFCLGCFSKCLQSIAIVGIIVVNRTWAIRFCWWAFIMLALRNVTIRNQTDWCQNGIMCCQNVSNIVTTPSTTQSSCRVSLNEMFHQDSLAQWRKSGRIYHKKCIKLIIKVLCQSFFYIIWGVCSVIGL